VPTGGTLSAIANPLSEKFAVLRPSLLPGLLDAVVYNRHREAASVRFFEVGAVFDVGRETKSVGWVLTGPRLDHWAGDRSPADFFDATGIAELVADAYGVTLRVEPADELAWFAPGRSARLVAEAGPDAVGSVGQIRADLVAARGLAGGDAVVGGVLSLDALDRARSGPRHRTMTPLPRHPSVVRDLSVLIDERLPAAGVRGTIRANAPETLVAVREFDRYQGAGVPPGQISLSLRLTFRAPARTLTDSEVQRAIDVMVAALVRDHGAVLRGGSIGGPQEAR
jgi:phenylalanyl-tRNA synthetase beta chain